MMDQDVLNSYELSRNWFDFCFENPDIIKPNHTAIYFFAIEHCNRLGWKKKFGLPSSMVMEAIGIKSYNTYIKCFCEIVEWGFLKLIEKSKNQYSSNIVALSKNDKAIDKALDKALIKHTSKQIVKQGESTSESIDSIDKQYNNKQLTNKPDNNKQPKPFFLGNEALKNCFEKCVEFFPEHLRPTTDKQKKIWIETIEKLNRIEKISFEKIIEIVKKTRSDDFWSKNFLSLVKLRKKNKEGLMYVVVFNENIKSKPTNKGFEADQDYMQTVHDSEIAKSWNT